MLSVLQNVFYSWRFYSLGRECYGECISKLFSHNLSNLRHACIIAGSFVAIFSIHPITVERDLIGMGIYLAVALICFLLAAFANYKMQTVFASDRFINTLIVIFYSTLMLFSIYLSVWGGISPLFFCFLISILLFFINPPTFNSFLTLSAIAVYLTATFIFKTYDHLSAPPRMVFIAVNEIVNVFIAGAIGLYFSWQLTKLRLGLEFSTSQLEEERNKYLDQSTTDELTKLRNRRDYMQTFQRFITNYRASDDWFCIACADIDFFKNYNDHYGHPQGDECLRLIGGAMNTLKESMGVYTARVGGEEFSALWFEKEASHVDDVIKKLMSIIRELEIPHEKSKASDFVTMSIGVYIVPCGSTNDVQSLYDLADKALYLAKGSGRNCAIVYGEGIKQYKITLPEEE